MSEDRPEARELGVSDAVYERIMSDLARRGQAPAYVAPPRRPPAARRSRRTVGLLVGVAVAALALRGLAGHPGAAAGGAGSYAFLTMDGDQPVAYTSCRPIDVAVYPAGGPSDAEALVREAVARAAGASGLDLRVIGSYGGAAPNWDFQAAPVGRDDPISVSWQDEAAIADLTDVVAGLGGSRVLDNPDGSQRLVAGTIALSRDYYALLDQRDDHDEEVAVLLHELGHVLGLDHVHDRGELMNEDNLGLTDYGPGDLAGLRLLGQGRCF